MGIVVRFFLKVAANAGALYLAASFLPGFTISAAPAEFIAAAAILALIHLIVRPILSLVSFPFIIITFGLFHIVINIALLWIGDAVTPSLTIADFKTLFAASIIVGLANAIF